MIKRKDAGQRHLHSPHLHPDDAALWTYVAGQATPLSERRDSGLRSTPATPLFTAPRPAREAAHDFEPLPPLGQTGGRTGGRTVAPRSLTGVDGGSARRLRRGRMPVDGRIDLHGMTQAAAHAALNSYLAGAHRDGRRCIIVITGKGNFPKSSHGQDIDAPYMRRGVAGVLRAAVPCWLREGANRERVIAFHPARPRDGGAGALYVVLRRRRDASAVRP